MELGEPGDRRYEGLKVKLSWTLTELWISGSGTSLPHLRQMASSDETWQLRYSPLIDQRVRNKIRRKGQANLGGKSAVRRVCQRM